MALALSGICPALLIRLLLLSGLCPHCSEVGTDHFSHTPTLLPGVQSSWGGILGPPRPKEADSPGSPRGEALLEGHLPGELWRGRCWPLLPVFETFVDFRS
jgi:hypothetical protein